ncbi:2TM domain-containing protein [Calothrix sp. UHCC 0171]|uniref:2TM domain-containing protein n=1 Tax=Calothrix sp. UHCC 0171 TaxID=3110245 RepID=UPI002B203483|nr:2TM domain-containing protein [Calothrix sp. UHCC 0171]MEA5571092.1 2TM domain-containing protein [Calothrix sp. UHCC 0171]
MTDSHKPTRFYSQEDVQQILHLAIARQVDNDDKEFSYEQLLEIANELEIAPESLKLAEGDWLSRQSETQQRLTFDAFRQKRFQKRLGNYAIFNGFLILVNLIGSLTISWSLYPLSFFILLIGLDAWNTFSQKGEDYEIAFQKWNRRHMMKKTFNNLVNRFLKAAIG